MHGDIAHSRTKVEHPIPVANACLTKKSLGERRDAGRLPEQPLLFAVCITEGVIGIGTYQPASFKFLQAFLGSSIRSAAEHSKGIPTSARPPYIPPAQLLIVPTP